MELGANKAVIEQNPVFKNLKLDDLRAYIKSKSSDDKKQLIDQMSLEDLSNYFNSHNQRQEDLETHALRVREKNFIDQLNFMKIEKQKASEAKQKQERQLGELMKEFTTRKDIELKAKFEKDAINRQLREIQKVKLTALENDKKRELERLAAQREAIRLQEQSLLDEVQKLNDGIKQKDDEFAKEREALQQKVNAQMNIGQYVRGKRTNMIKEYNEQIETFKYKKL